MNWLRVRNLVAWLSNSDAFLRQMVFIYSKYSGFFSVMKNVRSMLFAVLPSVPLPANGSKTRSPLYE